MSPENTDRLARRALVLLFLVALCNYMDRYVLGVLLPAIKADLAVNDTVLGFVQTAFTYSYVLFGLVLARLADTYSRKRIIAAAVTAWSVATALCGLAQNATQLAIARVLVGVGEAGALPPSHSIVSDYFPASKRGKAIAVVSIGAPVGIMVGFIAASYIVANYSWRVAFLTLGIPGLLLALLVALRLVEPTRGQADAVATSQASDKPPPLGTVLKTLAARAAYRHMCVATGIYTVVWIGVVGWMPSYFIRSFDMSITEVGFWLAVSLGVSQLIGMLASGVVTDIMIRRDRRWYGWVPALAIALSTPLFAIVFTTDNAIIACAALFPAFLIGVFQGPASLSSVQSLAPLRMRAMAVAIFLFVTNLIGGTLGPLIIGLISDYLNPTYGAESLRHALLIVSLAFGFWSALHYALSARSIRADIAATERMNAGAQPA